MKIATRAIDYLNQNYKLTDHNHGYEEFYELMEMSLTKNRPELFKLFINEFQYNSKFLKNFLTNQRLYYLYNFANAEEDEIKAPFSVLFSRKNRKFFSFEFIKTQLDKLLEIELIENYFSNSSKVRKFDESFQDSLFNDINWNNFINDQTVLNRSLTLEESKIVFSYSENCTENLFLWAILFNRVEIAKICLPMIQVNFENIQIYILNFFYYFIILESNCIFIACFNNI